ncbi:chromogranin-A isoform X2 [Triplophysa rosa]|uniref:Chromogranin-A n=2 Tax=Triplophysa rosa TaxID=992332 RepID=A0A9W7TP34_TRIRA|nr:chromogranin-A isoform X2 [Triplophysa rosa]KAI7799582.1 chromogranin-A precursor [Triplophysa rosa]
MKCIVEVIADVLTKPHPIPVSPDCLQTLSTDDRLVTLLRHRNFLQELQDIAAEGANERVQKHPDDVLDHVTSLPEDTKETADDQSMLVAMEKPEEAAEKRGVSEESSRESEESEQESQKRNNIAEEEENDAGNHISINPEQKRESQEEATIRDEEKQEEMKPPGFEKKEENELTHNKDGATLTDGLEANPEVKQSIMEDIEEPRGAEKERTHSQEEQKDEEEEENREVGPKHWSRLSKLAHKRVETGQKLEEHREASQHSKERLDQEGELWRSPEEQELQIMAQTEPEDKRDEEGSASRKTEDADIESLAAIESELESVAQKLHELRRG